MIWHLIGILALFTSSADCYCTFPPGWYGQSMYGHLAHYYHDFQWDFLDNNHQNSTLTILNTDNERNCTTLLCYEQYGPFYILYTPETNSFWCMKVQQVSQEVSLLRVRFCFNSSYENPSVCQVCESENETSGYISCYPDDELVGFAEPLACLKHKINKITSIFKKNFNTSLYGYNSSIFDQYGIDPNYNPDDDVMPHVTSYHDEYYYPIAGYYDDMYSNTTYEGYPDLVNGSYDESNSSMVYEHYSGNSSHSHSSLYEDSGYFDNHTTYENEFNGTVHGNYSDYSMNDGSNSSEYFNQEGYNYTETVLHSDNSTANVTLDEPDS